MKDSFDLNIINSGAFVKRGYSFILANVGKTIAIITLTVAALISFTEITFSEFGSKDFTSSLICMLIASYIMYFSLEDAGEKLAHDTEEYKNSLSEYEQARSAVNGGDIDSLREFCTKYREAELEYRRKNLLFSHGYTLNDYNAYKSGKKFPKKAMRELKRIAKLRPSDFTVSALMRKDGKQNDELKNPKKGKTAAMLMRLIPSTVCMFFTVSVMISAKDDLSVSSVIEGILKLATLPIMGLKGYTAGYEYAHESELEWIKTKTSLLNSFLSEQGGHKA